MSEEIKGIEAELKQLNYFLAQLIVEFKQLNDHLSNYNLLIANKQAIKQEEKEEKEEEGFKGDKDALIRYVKDQCPTLWANLAEVKEFKSGDFLVTIEYVSNNEFKKIANEVKQKLGGSYSKKWKGFIVKKKQ